MSALTINWASINLCGACHGIRDDAGQVYAWALILLGGLRELTALFVEAGRDVRGIVDPAITASTAILGRRGGV